MIGILKKKKRKKMKKEKKRKKKHSSTTKSYAYTKIKSILFLLISISLINFCAITYKGSWDLTIIKIMEKIG